MSFTYDYIPAADFDFLDPASDVIKALDKIPCDLESNRDRKVLAYLGNKSDVSKSKYYFLFLVCETYYTQDKGYDQIYAVCSIGYSNGEFNFDHSSDVEF